MRSSPYEQLPTWGRPPGPPTQTVKAAFDIDRGLRRGIGSLRRAPLVLLLGGFAKACTEGGSGGNVRSSDELDDLRRLFENAGAGGHGSLLTDPTQWYAGAPPLDLALFGDFKAGLILLLLAVVLVVTAFFVLAGAWLGAGWIRLHEEIIRTGEGNASTIFGAIDVFPSMVGWTMVTFLLGIVGIAAALLPVAGVFFVPEDGGLRMAFGAVAALFAFAVAVGLVYLRLGLAFVPHVITLERQPVMAAIERSFALTEGGRFHLLLYMAVFSFLGVLATLPGYCLCIVGALVTRPLGVALRDLPYTDAFLRLTRPAEEVAAYSITTWADD